MNWRVHFISILVLVFTIGAIRLVWDNPQIIIYLLLAAISLLAYGAIYIMVKSRMEKSQDRFKR